MQINTEDNKFNDINLDNSKIKNYKFRFLLNEYLYILHHKMPKL